MKSLDRVDLPARLALLEGPLERGRPRREALQKLHQSNLTCLKHMGYDIALESSSGGQSAPQWRPEDDLI